MNTFSASTTGDWRAWLARNCRSEKEVWLVVHHSGSGTPGPRYHEAIEQALCYGWIDSQARKHDADSCILRFTPRTPRSAWSRVNRDRAAKMTEQGLMTEHGQALIDLAKADGTWQVVSDAHSSAIPPDLQELLDRKETARRNFHNFRTGVPGITGYSAWAVHKVPPSACRARPNRQLALLFVMAARRMKREHRYGVMAIATGP